MSRVGEDLLFVWVFLFVFLCLCLCTNYSTGGFGFLVELALEIKSTVPTSIHHY